MKKVTEKKLRSFPWKSIAEPLSDPLARVSCLHVDEARFVGICGLGAYWNMEAPFNNKMAPDTSPQVNDVVHSTPTHLEKKTLL